MGESRCLHCIVEGQPKKEWTCQCGYGYWDAVQQKFVPGSQVRSGKALSRADYEAHLQTCSACRNKAAEDDLILPTVDPPWFDGDYGPNSRPWQKPKSSPGRQRKLPGQIEMFLPGKDIDADILGRYILDQVDSKGHVSRGTREDVPGYFVTANTRLTVDMITSIKSKSLKVGQAPSRPGRPDRPDFRHGIHLPERRKPMDSYAMNSAGPQAIMVASVALGQDPKEATKTNCLLTDVKVKLPHADRLLTALVDSGAERNVISQKFADEEGLRTGKAIEKTHSFDGHPVPVYGQLSLNVEAIDRGGITKTAEHEFLATDCKFYDVILGYPWLVAVDADCDWGARAWRYRTQCAPTLSRRNTGPLLSEPTRVIPPSASDKRNLMDQGHDPRLDSPSPDYHRPSPLERTASSPDRENSRGIRDMRDVRDPRAARDPRELQSSRSPVEPVGPRGVRGVRDARNLRDVRSPRDSHNPHDARDNQDARDTRYEHVRNQGTRRDQVDERSQLTRTTSYNLESESPMPRSSAGPAPNRAEVEREVIVRLRDSGAQVTRTQLDQAVDAAMQALLQRRQP